MEATEEVAQIMKSCGFIDNLIKDIEINEKIRKLENEARKNRPLSASKTEPLTRFLSKEEALELRDLKIEKQKLKNEERKIMICTSREIKKHDIILIKTKKGTFAEQPPFKTAVVKSVEMVKKKKEEKKKKEDKEEYKGLSALFE